MMIIWLISDSIVAMRNIETNLNIVDLFDPVLVSGILCHNVTLTNCHWRQTIGFSVASVEEDIQVSGRIQVKQNNTMKWIQVENLISEAQHCFCWDRLE